MKRIDGGISALGALLDALMMVMGFIGLVVFGSMFGALDLLKRRKRVSIGSGLIVALAIAFVLFAAFCAIFGTESSLVWLPAVAGVAVLVQVVRFFRRRSQLSAAE